MPFSPRRPGHSAARLGQAAVAVVATTLFLATASAPRLAAQDTPVLPNDNRTPAGELEDGVLTLRVEARSGMFHPQGPDGPGFEVEAFGEAGGPTQNPGPMIRVPAGTLVHAYVTNTLNRPLLVRGLHDRGQPVPDPIDVPPGRTEEVRFRLSRTGTYYYWGRTSDSRNGLGVFEDGQLKGAIVVDPPEAAVDDEVLFIGLWVNRADRDSGADHVRHTFLINGLSWPFTERMNAVVGDSVRLRVINGTPASHPMHLHGFYYRVDARGDAQLDTIYTPEQQRLAVTENMLGGTTLALSWLPKRPGHWLFHCHFIEHISPEQHVLDDPTEIVHEDDGSYPGAEPRTHERLHEHAYRGMAGLMMGVLVRDPEGKGLVEDPDAPRRHLRIFANVRPRYFGDEPGFGYILQEDHQPPAMDSIRIPGTPLILTRDEPVEITVHNRTPVPITVHWHGIELDSYYDGIAGWSGAGSRLTPAIEPRDSFAVRFTPDRAGTFIYHTHMEEAAQLSSGLYAPLIVLEPGETYDADTDRIFLMGWGGPGENAPPFLNGTAEPSPLDLEAGRSYRLRFINITPSNNQQIRLLEGGTVSSWRRFGKDGANLPPHQAVVVPAEQFLGAGETYDFEIHPDRPQHLVLEVTTRIRGRENPVMKVPIRVR